AIYNVRRMMSERQRLRHISDEVFNRPHQLEVAQAVALQEESFQAGDVIDAIGERCSADGEEPPSDSAVRKNLTKLARLGVVKHVKSTVRGSAGIWTREPGPFWEWLKGLEAVLRN